MNDEADNTSPVRLHVQNIGGISQAETALSEGVTLISGRNATNKSSLLESLSGVLGGPLPSIKSNADRGSVRMEVGDDEYFIELLREGGQTVLTESDRYSEASDYCDLFVALTETNPIRQAILTGDDIYELLMRPVDTDEIEAEIQRLSAEKNALDEQISELDAMEQRLPGLRTRRNSLERELSDVESTLRETRDAIEDIESETDLEDDEGRTELNRKRSERNDLQTRIRTTEDAIESLKAELDTVGDELDDLDVEVSETTVAEIEDELEQLHYQKQQLTSTINGLSPVVEMNSQFLDTAEEIPEAMTDDDIVADLDPDSKRVTCWTCGSTVERAEIAKQVDAVRDIVQEKRNQRDSITSRIQALTEQKRNIEQQQDKIQRLEDRREQIEAEIGERTEKLENLRAERRALESEIERLQRQKAGETHEQQRLSELYDEVSDLEYERGQLSSSLESVEAEIAEIESELSKRATLQDQRESVAEDLQEQRDRIDSLEQDLATTFNEVMQRVLETLEYRSIERIWIERHSTGDRTLSEKEFELHVARTTDDGKVYDDTVENLSKSEREVVGLIVALAGYLAHDVSDDVPFLVVDAVEMLDADRIRGLMEHFSEYATYVIATVLPEEQRELDGVYESISTSTLAADS